MPTQRMTLVLWDIDHTLIESRGAGQIVYESVFPRIVGRPFQRLAQVAGRTELDIIHDTLALHGVEPTDELVRRLADALADGYRQTGALAERGRALPGVLDAVKALSEEAALYQSVLTGNTREVAKIKVETFGLDQYLDLELGAFGDDHRDRPELVAIARERASKKLGATVHAEDVVLIGDTPGDVEAALRSGAHIIAVATGKSSIEDLKAAGAGVVLADLAGGQPLRAVVEDVVTAHPRSGNT